VLRFGESDSRLALGETSGRSPLTGVELRQGRSREVRRLEQVVGTAVVLARLPHALWFAHDQTRRHYRRPERTA
jgi:hypothetical protein